MIARSNLIELGESYEKLGKIEEAIQWYKRAEEQGSKTAKQALKRLKKEQKKNAKKQ